MLNDLIHRALRLLSAQAPDNDPSMSSWQADPLSHPDLQAMTLHQLADLPFEPFGLPRSFEPERGSSPVPANRPLAACRTA